ncbi:MAG: NAD(P)H-binding protein [Tepidisphaera sp.]|nr:NAD(P)H-binding protein [Tepidisphaera sp.]
MERRTDGPLMLVTAAAGKTGALVAHELLERGQRVRALLRRVDARSKALESLGAQIVVGDMADVGQMEAALRGVERAYFCAPWEPHMLHMAEVFAQAARANGVNAIIEMTQWLSNPDHPSLATRQSWLITRMLASLPGVAHVVVNPGYFADNYLRLMPFAAHLGVLPNLTGDSRNAPPSNEDIARVIAACMLDPERHAGQTYRPTGPALLSVPEMAGIVGKVLGRSVRAVPLPWAMFAKAARAEGVSRFMVHELSFYVEEHRRGTFALAAPNDHVLRATGRAAEDFETSARRYAALPQAKRSFGALVDALAHQMRIGLTPGVNLAAYRKATQYPMPASPTYSDASPRWREEHGVPGAASGGQRVAGRGATPRMA